LSGSSISGFYHDEGMIKVITGSSSYLLPGKLATNLIGRYLEFDVLALDFSECLGISTKWGFLKSFPTEKDWVVGSHKKRRRITR